MKLKRCKFYFIVIILFLSSVFPGEWIIPDFKGQEPNFNPVAWDGPDYNRKVSTYVFRSEFTADEETTCVYLLISYKDFFVVRINGKVSAEYPNRYSKEFSRKSMQYVRNEEGKAAVICTYGLKPGKNIIAVSTTKGGFAAAGAVVQRDRDFTAIDTSDKWMIRVFPPASVIQYEPSLMTVQADDNWFNTSVFQDADSLKIKKSTMLSEIDEYMKLKIIEYKNNCIWRLEALIDQGFIIDDWESFGFGSAGRYSETILSIAGDMLIAARKSESEQIWNICDGVDALTMMVRLQDEAENLNNTASVISKKQAKISTKMKDTGHKYSSVAAAALQQLKVGKYNEARKITDGYSAKIKQDYRNFETALNNPLNYLNDSDFNRFGWFDNVVAIDNNISEWGIRVNPLEASWRINLNGKWRFKLDPKNTGIKDTVHDVAYNIENQWPQINVPGDWESQGYRELNPNCPDDNPYDHNKGKDGPYNGYAWYRKTLYVPADWAGNDLILYYSKADDFDWAYFNGKEIGHTGYDNHPTDFWKAERFYTIPKKLVKFGTYNVIAIRLYDSRGTSYLGDVELRCPSLKAAFEKKKLEKPAPKTRISTSPLAIGSILTLGGDTLNLWGWIERGLTGPDAVILPLEKGTVIRNIKDSGEYYDEETDGKLKENWILIWKNRENQGQEKPLLLSLTKNPQKINVMTSEKGTSGIDISFKESGVSIIASQPVQEMIIIDKDIPENIIKLARGWSKILLAYPISFTEVNFPSVKNKWILEVTDVYHYKIFENEWDIKPVKIALLPVFTSYAIKNKYSDITIPDNVKSLKYSLGKFGELQGVIGTDRITYFIPLDRIKAFGGTTTFAFADKYDINQRNITEIRAVKAYGGTAWRPQTALGPGQYLGHAIKAAKQYDVNLMHNCSSGHIEGKYEGMIKLYGDLAKAYADMDFEHISYDPFNEPADVAPEPYNEYVKKVISTIRKYDKKHLIYIESPQSYASVLMLEHIKPFNDELTVYSFHDYVYRLKEYWPNEKFTIRSLYNGWYPAFEIMIERQRPIHLGEYGGFEQIDEPWVFSRPHTITEKMDMLKIFQHFHMHFNYYASRGTTRLMVDGSLDQSFVQEAFYRFFERGHYNWYHNNLK